MQNLLEFKNIFTKEQYPPNEKNISEVPYQDIQDFLLTNFGSSGYSIKVVWTGSAIGRSGPENCVVIELTIPLKGGETSITVPGSSQGSIGIPGLITNAIRNAVLRHLGTGAGLYEHAEGEEPQFGNAEPANPFKQAQQHSFSQGQTYGPPATAGKQYGPWTGEVKVKSGQFEGLKWNQIPDDNVAKMAGLGIGFAQKELARRQGA